MIGQMPLWLVVVILIIAMGAAYEAGMWLHVRLRSRADAARRDSGDESQALAGVFGLLALLMAFAFSLALDRYEERRALVTAEGNAVGTFAVRLQLLPPAQRAPLHSELRDYAAARLDLSSTDDSTVAGQLRVDRLYDALGRSLYAKLAEAPPDVRTSLLVQAFDTLGDAATERRAARSARLPTPVLALLMLYCIAGAAMLGYAVAAVGARHRISATVFFLLLGLAFATVLDLDRPRGGMIVVPQDELELAVAQL